MRAKGGRCELEVVAGSPEDTIVAIATPAGVGAISVVRMSGPEAVEIARRVFRPASGRFPTRRDSHKLVYGHLVDPGSGEEIDEVMLVVMWAPRTYTREDLVEIDCHGGSAAQRAALRALIAGGARVAEPGEFTRRAFLNGRIDLAQAESVAAIVEARTEVALRAAVRQLEGALSARVRGLRARLVGVLAQLEVQIDFSDEDCGDLDFGLLGAELEEVAQELEQLLSTAFAGRVLVEGLRVAIVGRPNVGKSSLLNALAMRERAIVSEIAGTTRDTVEELVEISGLPVCFVDTAGLREAGGVVEEEGVRRSRAALEGADLVLAVTDLTREGGPSPQRGEWRLGELGLDESRTIVVVNKADLTGAQAEEVERAGLAKEWASRALSAEGLGGGNGGKPESSWSCCVASARYGWGINRLRALMRDRALGVPGISCEEGMLATERQRALVSRAAECVMVARQNMAGVRPSEEIIAEDVRTAGSCLGRITGEELVEDVLDEVFSCFCIGK